MILAQGYSLACSAEDWSWVPSISDVVMFLGDEQDVGSAAYWASYKLFFELVDFLVLVANHPEIILSFRRFDELVYIFEGLVKGNLVTPFLICLQLGELFDQDLAHEFTHFKAYITEMLPPWPSNTPKRAFPSSILSSHTAASSMVFLHPWLWQVYLAFLLRQN